MDVGLSCTPCDGPGCAGQAGSVHRLTMTPPMKPTLSIAGALAAALGSMLAGAPANAAAGCAFGNPAGSLLPACTVPGGANFSTQQGDKLFTIVTEPTFGSGDVEFTVDPSSTVWQIDVDWAAFGLAGPAANGLFEYTVQINTGNNQFASISLDVAGDHPNPSTTVEKQVFSGLGAVGAPIATLASVNGSDVLNVPISGTQIFVRDVYNVPDGNTLDNMGNYIRQDVPGPLPLVGAAMALGMARRLRRRVALEV